MDPSGRPSHVLEASLVTKVPPFYLHPYTPTLMTALPTTSTNGLIAPSSLGF